MKRLRFSTSKYEYLVNNIDFLDFILTEQIREGKEEIIDMYAFAEFLTTSIYNENNEVDIVIYGNQESFKKELEILRGNLKEFENKDENDKVIHLLNHLIGSLDLELSDSLRILQILLEYIEYHKLIQKTRKIR